MCTQKDFVRPSSAMRDPRTWIVQRRAKSWDFAIGDQQPEPQPPADGGLADLNRYRAQVEGNPWLQRQAARRDGPKPGEDPGIEADFNRDPKE